MAEMVGYRLESEVSSLPSFKGRAANKSQLSLIRIGYDFLLLPQ